MQTKAPLRPRTLALGLLLAAVLAGLVAAGGRGALALYLRQGQVRAEATLDLTASALDGWLRRFESVPRLLADDEVLRRLVLRPGAPVAPRWVEEANAWLRERNAVLQSAEIYVLGLDGTTLAASNADAPDSFVGRNFAFRPYFLEAKAGGIGRFFGLGTTSGVRGYYFAGPIRDAAGAVRGVVAVKVGLDGIERAWRTGVEEVMVTDPEGLVFLASEPGWLRGASMPLTPERLARTQASRRYADAPLGGAVAARARAGAVTLATLPQAGAPREFVEVLRPMPEAGWTVHVLLDTAPLRTQARIATALLLSALGAGGLGAHLVWQRRQRGRERLALEERAKVELERRVAERTAELAEANRLVVAEVAERRAAEAELRRTQADLVQAGKLAALGRMAAALSHEINQPLAAVRNYADSAEILIDRGEPARARENVARILQLVDRMAAIARHLREVARKPENPLREVDLGAALDEALVVVGPRLGAAGATLRRDLPAGLGPVRAGPVRLQQVLVNLLGNALDAVEGRPDPRIEVRARPEGGRVLLTIADNGPGVPAAIADRIFDPFFTTKGVGAGLGLGLSISYNIVRDFGGQLSVADAAGGGAAFTLRLAAAGAAADPGTGAAGLAAE